MAKKQTKKANRKRRSFFEPESKVLAAWLGDQNDLGVSLQLIIVDAIRNYGEGDVIQAFLTARESITGEPQVTSALPTPKASADVKAPIKATVPTPEPVKQTAKIPVPTAKSTIESAPVLTPLAPSEPEPEDDWELPEEVATEPVAAKAQPVKPQPTPEPEDEWELPQEVATEPVAPKKTALKPATKSEPELDNSIEESAVKEGEPDPLNIMFADAGSKLRE